MTQDRAPTEGRQKICLSTAGFSCHHGPIEFQGNGINPYIWCAVGAVIGWLASLVMAGGGRVVMIENIGVGVFGAFIGGDFLATMTGAVAANDTSFHMVSLLLAAGSALTMLLALKLMRSAVGPMKAGKSRARDRR